MCLYSYNKRFEWLKVWIMKIKSNVQHMWKVWHVTERCCKMETKNHSGLSKITLIYSDKICKLCPVFILWRICICSGESGCPLMYQIFCKFFVLPFRQKNSQFSDFIWLHWLNWYFGLKCKKISKEQLNFLHWLHWVLRIFFSWWSGIGEKCRTSTTGYNYQIFKKSGKQVRPWRDVTHG